MAHLHHKSDTKKHAIFELFAVVVVIILFWVGLKFGMKSAAELLSDHQDAFWFGIVKVAAGILCGFIPAGACIGLYIYIVMLLRKNKE